MRAMALILSLWLPAALAEMRLPPPAELAQRAQQGRTDLREVILDIEANIAEMRDPATFDSYFQLLDRLQEFATRLNLDEIYPNAVMNLGNQMADHGLRWLDLTKVTQERVVYITKWMHIDSITRMLSDAEIRVTAPMTPDQIRTFVDNISSILAEVERRFPDRTDIANSWRRVSSELAVKFLGLPGISEDDVKFWIKKIRLPSTMATYLEQLNWTLDSIKPGTKSTLHIILKRFLLIKDTLAAEPSPPPPPLLVALGQSAENLISRFVQLEEPFTAGEAESAVSLLRQSQLKDLSQLLQSQERLPSDAYIRQFLQLAAIVVERLKDAGMMTDAQDLSRWVGSVAAALHAKERNLEGMYELKDVRGKTWYLTLAQARESLLYAALTDADGFVFKSLFNVTYDVVTDELTAAEREPDLDGTMNQAIKIAIKDNGDVLVRDLFARRLEWRELKGKKVQEFPNYFLYKNDSTKPLQGTYVGKVTLPADIPLGNGRRAEYSATLIVWMSYGYSSGRLQIDGAASEVDVEFITGSKGMNGVIYLTTVRNYRTQGRNAWFQIRARQTATGLEGHVIISGRGVSDVPFVMTKVQD